MYLTYADIFRPNHRQYALVYDIVLVIVGSVLIALSAQLSINLPFSPVPITGQTFAVLFIAALFGSRRGSATVLAYLAEGAAGMPVFANGMGGAHVLVGPTGGYLIGFVLAAFLVGWLAEKGWDRRIVTTIIAMIFGNLVIYAVGVTWLGAMIGYNQAFTFGLRPFIPGDLVKILVATALLPAGWKLLGKSGPTTGE